MWPCVKTKLTFLPNVLFVFNPKTESVKQKNGMTVILGEERIRAVLSGLILFFRD